MSLIHVSKVGTATESPSLPPYITAPRSFGWFDLVLIVSLSISGILTFPVLTADHMSTVIVFRDNKIAARFPLSENREASLSCVHGRLSISITDGFVSVNHSDCPNHLCQRSGRIRSVNSQIICAPNHIIITITGSKEAAVDAILR